MTLSRSILKIVQIHRRKFELFLHHSIKVFLYDTSRKLLLRGFTMSIDLILKKSSIPSKENAIPGRSEAVTISGIHAVTEENITRLPNESEAMIVLGMGCFWGAERKLWNTRALPLPRLAMLEDIQRTQRMKKLAQAKRAIQKWSRSYSIQEKPL
jgi:hypothetical protein